MNEKLLLQNNSLNILIHSSTNLVFYETLKQKCFLIGQTSYLLQLAGALAEEGCALEQIVEAVTEALRGIGKLLFYSLF